MHKNIHVHLYKITIEYTRTLLYNTVRNKENKDIKERLEGRNNMLVKNAMNYIKRLEKMVWQRFTGAATTIKTDDDCDMIAVSVNFYVNGRYCWICAYDDDDVITWYVSGKGTAKEMTIEDTQVKSMYKVLDKVEELAYELDMEETTETTEAEETKGKETEESTASEETHLAKITGSTKRKADNQAYNSMCYNCKKFLNGCRGEKNKIYSGCVYKEKMEVRNNG